MTIVSQSTYSGPASTAPAPAASPAAAPAPAPAPMSALVAPRPAKAPAAPAAPAPAATAPAAPAPAAPAAPAVPITLDEPAAPAPAPAAAPDAEADSIGQVVTVVYDKTGDAGLDMALNFLGTHGYSPDHPAMKAAADGNFGLLKAELSAKGVKGAAEYLALGEQAYTAMKTKTDAKIAEDRKGILDKVGGEKQWETIRKWASEKTTAEEKSQISKTMSEGGIAARAMAAYLADLHAKASGTTVQPANAVNLNAAQSVTPSSGTLSPDQYKAGIAELKSRIGSANLDQHPEYKALNSRRRAWRA